MTGEEIEVNVMVNGEPRTVPEGCTTAQLVADLGVSTNGIAVAVDGEVMPRARWQTALPRNATVEVLTAVQGG